MEKTKEKENKMKKDDAKLEALQKEAKRLRDILDAQYELNARGKATTMTGSGTQKTKKR